ncbi:hypothetical protein V8D89_006667 [Ganoderma adspersum]
MHGGPHGLVSAYPYVSGFDGAGVVKAIGAEVTNVVKGDRVYVLSVDEFAHDGQAYVPGVSRKRIPNFILNNIAFDQAATVSLCLAWNHEEDSHSVRFAPPCRRAARPTSKYAGQAALILGGGTNVGQSGSLGATHVLDRALAPDALPPTAPITYVYDIRDVQRLGYDVLAPGGAFVSVMPFDDGALADLVEGSAWNVKGKGKRVARVRASYVCPGNMKLGVEIFERITSTGWPETGVIVLLLCSGLAGIAAGCERMLRWDVGAKLVVHVDKSL